jgi:hypothetical protein
MGIFGAVFFVLGLGTAEPVEAKNLRSDILTYAMQATATTEDSEATADTGEAEENDVSDSAGSQETDTDNTDTDITEEIVDSNFVRNLQVKEKKNQGVQLDWSSGDTAMSFLIYRKKESGSYKKLAVTEEITYLDTTINTQKKYTYRVVPVNEDGTQGEAVRVTWIPRPQSVKGLHTTCQSEKKVLIEWKKSSYANNYKIYRKQGNGSYHKIAETTKVSYVDRTITWGKKYTYKIVAYNKNNYKSKASKITYQPSQIVTVSSQKYSYSQMQKDLKALSAMYSDYCTLTSIGKSVQKREIYDFSIGNPDASQSLLIVCTLHAREYICSVMAMKQIEYYLRNYNQKIDGTTPQKIFSKIQIHYVVMANPDGVSISQGSKSYWKANANGVDLNRNFPASPFHVGGIRGAEGYSGAYALSEPESRAVANLTKELKKNQNLAGVISYHAMGRMIFGSCNSRKLSKDTSTMYQIARNLTHYGSSASYYSASAGNGGQYRDYVMDQLEIPSITIEIGSTSCPCAYREYDTEFQKNKKVVLKIAAALKE